MTDNIREQFSLVYDQYIEKIYRFIYVKVSSQEVAEDLTSKTFLKAWEAYNKGKDIKNPGAFLYQIARNLTIDYYRQKDRKKTVSMDAVGQVVDHSPSSHESAILNAEVEMIKRAISGLKKEYQDIIILYYLEDMSSDHIAQIMGKSPGTIRVMIHRALEALRQQLED